MPTARAAVADDIDEIVRVVTAMFLDLGDAEVPAAWAALATAALHERLWTDVGAFVVDAPTGDGVAAVAVGNIETRLPSPRRASPQIGYIDWVATATQWRRHGFGLTATRALVDWMDEMGAAVIHLHSSTDASDLYARLGFTPSAHAMRRGPGQAAG